MAKDGWRTLTCRYLLPGGMEAYPSLEEVVRSHPFFPRRFGSQELLVFIFDGIDGAVSPSMPSYPGVKAVSGNGSAL